MPVTGMPVRPLISVLGATSTSMHNAITRLCHSGNIRRPRWMSDQRSGHAGASAVALLLPDHVEVRAERGQRARIAAHLEAAGVAAVPQQQVQAGGAPGNVAVGGA